MSILQTLLTKNARYDENKEYSVLYESPLQSGYTDVTSTIAGWYDHGIAVGKDYKFVRAKIKGLITTFGLLSDDDKQMAGEFMAPSPAIVEADGILGGDFDKFLGEWIANSKACRIQRWEALKVEAFGLITEGMKGLSKVIVDGLYIKYIEGIESKALDGEVSIFDWIESTDVYAAAGLINGGYTAINPPQTMAQISVLLMDIIKNGNY